MSGNDNKTTNKMIRKWRIYRCVVLIKMSLCRISHYRLAKMTSDSNMHVGWTAHIYIKLRILLITTANMHCHNTTLYSGNDIQWYTSSSLNYTNKYWGQFGRISDKFSFAQICDPPLGISRRILDPPRKLVKNFRPPPIWLFCLFDCFICLLQCIWRFCGVFWMFIGHFD
mgnify:FL=1